MCIRDSLAEPPSPPKWWRNIWTAPNSDVWPVSYTHLDVYKRQKYRNTANYSVVRDRSHWKERQESQSLSSGQDVLFTWHKMYWLMIFLTNRTGCFITRSHSNTSGCCCPEELNLPLLNDLIQISYDCASAYIHNAHENRTCIKQHLKSCNQAS